MVDRVNIMNIKTNEDIMMDSIEPPYIIEEIAWGLPDISFGLYRTPFQIGETIDSTVVKSRKPLFTGYVVSKDIEDSVGMNISSYFLKQKENIEISKTRLSKVLNIYQDILIKTNGYKIKGRLTGPVNYSEKYSENNEVLCKFTFEVQCYEPMFYRDKKQYTLSSTIRGFHFPFVIPESGFIFGIRNVNNIVHIYNGGESEVGMTVRVSAVRGSVSNFKIEEVGTENMISVKGYNLDFGDTMVLETEAGKEDIYILDSITGERTRIVNWIEYDSYFIRLQIGETILVFSAKYNIDEAGESVVKDSIGNADVVIEFTERYFNFGEM